MLATPAKKPRGGAARTHRERPHAERAHVAGRHRSVVNRRQYDDEPKRSLGAVILGPPERGKSLSRLVKPRGYFCPLKLCGKRCAPAVAASPGARGLEEPAQGLA